MRVTVALSDPAKDGGTLYPEPEFCMGLRYMVIWGLTAASLADLVGDGGV